MSRIVKANSVVIVPVTDYKEIIFIREYHPAVNRTFLTLPGGRIDKGEQPEQTAIRELREEIGYAATGLEKLSELLISPGYISQHTSGFIALGLQKEEAQLEDTEIIKLEPHPITEIDMLISSNQLIEARDIAFCLLTKKKLEESAKFQHIGFKNFNKWNRLKQTLQYKGAMPPLFKERDIWWCSIGANLGFEEDGKQEKFVRPVLIVKKFNREMFLGIPLSTKNKDNPYYVPITVKGETVSALISQLRVFSSKRMQNKLAGLDSKDYQSIVEKITNHVLPLPNNRKSRG